MRDDNIKLLCIVGTRPNFVKMAALYEAFRAHPSIAPTLVHTGQHYDHNMSHVFFQELSLPKPDVNLGISGGSNTNQTARMMLAFEKLIHKRQPDIVLVVGDVNSTLAAALVAAKEEVLVAHVEAGLRSRDRTMPEELNRIVVDHLSDFLFATEQSGVENLRKEGIDESKVFLVGNVMVDTLKRCMLRAAQSRVLDQLGIKPKSYVLTTIHRPANTDDLDRLSEIVRAVRAIGQQRMVIFPVHPRTMIGLKRLGDDLSDSSVRIIDPMGYLDFLWTMKNAYAVLTDSGGIQEETTILGVPCLTARENTERPITIDRGTNRLVGVKAESIISCFLSIGSSTNGSSDHPPYWDGKAAGRIVDVLRRVSIGQGT